MKCRLWCALSVALAALLGAGSLATSAWASTSVTEYRCGFEGGVLPPGWKANATFMVTSYEVMADPAYAHTGSWELKQDIAPYSDSNERTDLKLSLPDDGVRYELDAWFYVDRAFAWGMTSSPFTFVFPGGKTVGAEVSSDSGSPGFLVVRTGSGSRLFSERSVPQRTWHNVHITYDRLAGTEDVLLDGVPVATAVPVDTAGLAPSTATFSSLVPYAYRNGMRQYLDDCVVSVSRPNGPPAVSASRDFIAGLEGATLSNDGLVSDPDGDPVTLTASRGTVTDRGDGSWSWRQDAADGPGGGGPVTITASDGEDARSVTFTCAVSNVAPVPALPPLSEVEEGAVFSAEGAFTDPGADTWSGTVDYGDGSGEQGLVLGEGKSFALEHVYPDDGPYEVRVRVRDDDGDIGEASALVTVTNAAPTVVVPAEGTSNEGSLFSAEGRFADPGADVWTGSVDYGDGSPVQELELEGGTFTLSHAYVDDGRYDVRVTVRDEDGGAGSAVCIARVADESPVVAALQVEATGLEARASVPFTDTGVEDLHTASWEWGDGTTSPATIVESNGAGVAAGRHTYLQPGTYRVRVVVSDGDGGAGTSWCDHTLTLADTSLFVTGGGWFTSPAGAVPSQPDVTGKATYGFVARIESGAATPTGSFEFRLHQSKMTFKSTGYDWLTGSGDTARFGGRGTLGGEGDYSFLVVAKDGARDALRLRIWDTATGEVVYDNQPGTPSSAEPVVEPDGGNIVVHAKEHPPARRHERKSGHGTTRKGRR